MLSRIAKSVNKITSKSLSLLRLPNIASLQTSPNINNKHTYCTETIAEINDDFPEREKLEFDVIIVGGGPAGLSSAIRLKQLAIEHDTEIEICVIEKGAEIGSHIMSGNVFDPIALNELIPDWKAKGAPLHQKVTNDEFWYMTSNGKYSSPYIPPSMNNDGNYIISLSELCRWLGEEAENMDINILPGFSASEALYNDNNTSLIGIATSDLGLLKDGSIGPNFERGTEIIGRQTILSEGCRGSISEDVMQFFKLRSNCDPQIYGIGLKEVWRVSDNNKYYSPGTVIHALGYPIPSDVYGGNFIYHCNDKHVLIGCVIGLEYTNTYLNPYMEFQKLKTHPEIRQLLEGGECIGYGARAINEGGYQSVPQLSFPGGVFAGCSAGFVNVPKVKGTHYAMKSGILAAENMFPKIKKQIDDGIDITDANTTSDNILNISEYDNAVRDSYIMKDLYNIRNVKPSYNYGRIPGLLHSALTVGLTKGKEPWTLRNGYKCCDKTKPKSECTEIKYDKPDGILTFDILTNLQRTNTYHKDDEPPHLKIKPELINVANKESYDIYGGPESRFCPAKVYEYIEDTDNGKMKLVINSQNCIHCKTCSIKTPKEFIKWTVPQGGGGPKYAGM